MNKLYLLLLLASFLLACRQEQKLENDTVTPTTEASDVAEVPQTSLEHADLDQVMEEGREVFGESTVDAEAAGLVDVAQLKSLFPKELNGMPRNQLFGETVHVMGFDLVEANAVYTTKVGENLNIDVIDTGGHPPAVLMFAGWAKSDVNRDTPNGTEKTAYLGERKILEKYNPTTKRGEVSTLVNMRFVIKVRSRNIEMEQLRQNLSTLDLDKFASLTE